MTRAVTMRAGLDLLRAFAGRQIDAPVDLGRVGHRAAERLLAVELVDDDVDVRADAALRAAAR